MLYLELLILLKLLQDLKNNPELLKADWGPNKFGGSQYNINYFIYENNVLKIVPSKAAKIIPLIVIILFAALPVFFSLINHKENKPIIFSVFGLIDIVFIILYIRLFIKIEINPIQDTIKKGFNLSKAKTIAKVSDIVFIQVVEQKINQKKNNYYSYEINLVMKNKDRISLTDHADFDVIKTQSQQLKAFLNKSIYTKSTKTSEIIELA